MTEKIRIDETRQLRLHRGTRPAVDYLFLPGFGCGGGVFSEQVGTDLPVLGVDLPFITSDWKQPKFTPEEIAELVRRVCARFQLDSVGLIGHSLGARLLLKILPLIQTSGPEITRLILIAPDGVGGRYTSWLDRLPTATFPVLQRFLERPSGLLRFAKWLKKRRLIDTFSFQYLRHHLRQPEYRRLLTGTLRSLPQFRLGSTEYDALERTEWVTVLYGKDDPIIVPAKLHARLGKRKGVEMIPFPGGHVLPRRELMAILKEERS